MAEWSIAAVLKTVELRGSGGSNPSLSAKRKDYDAPAYYAGVFFMQKIADDRFSVANFAKEVALENKFS